jgi:hypothetical protein
MNVILEIELYLSSSHFSNDERVEATELNIILRAIPPGCTILIQICDLIADKPIKQAFKNDMFRRKSVTIQFLVVNIKLTVETLYFGLKKQWEK